MKQQAKTFYRYLKKYVLILEDCEPFKPAMLRFGSVLVFYFICLQFMSAANLLAAMRYPQEPEPLPDLGFDLLPAHDWRGLSNFFLLFSGLQAIRFIFHRKGLTIIRRFMTIHGITAILRAFTITATSYPDPSFECAGYKPPEMKHFWKAIISGRNDLAYTCGDLMPSGHTPFFIIMAMQWHRHTTLIERIFAWVFAITGCFTLVVTRLHYTNDVIIGAYFAFTVSYIYYIFANDPNYRRKSFILSWLEADFQDDKDGGKSNHTHQLLDVQDDMC